MTKLEARAREMLSRYDDNTQELPIEEAVIALCREFAAEALRGMATTHPASNGKTQVLWGSSSVIGYYDECSVVLSGWIEAAIKAAEEGTK